VSAREGADQSEPRATAKYSIGRVAHGCDMGYASV
jgi:hypothetical protein